MGKDYITRHGILTSAVNVYTALSTGSDGSTPASVKVPQGRNRISAIISTFSIDGALIVDVGNIAVIKLSGKALPQGDQELLVGSVQSQETGTSVSLQVNSRRVYRQSVSISCIGGNEITVSGTYLGTDLGSQAISITLEFSNGGGPVANYYVRFDSMAQATTTFAAIDTTAENTTSQIVTERSASKVARIFAAAIINAAAVDTGNNFIVKLSGTGMTEQEIVVYSTTNQKGAGSITATSVDIAEPTELFVDIDIRGGNILVLSGAYLGTDPGTPILAIGLEVF